MDASAAQVSELADEIRATEWRAQRELTECPDQAYVFADGGAMFSVVTVKAGMQETPFGVSDRGRAVSKHSAHGKVMSDESFGRVFDLVLAIRPGGPRPVDKYW